MQVNFDSTGVAGHVMTLPAPERDERAKIGRRRRALSARAEIARGESWENAAWAVIALIGLGALAVSFAF